jgi:hypothetical protein
MFGVKSRQSDRVDHIFNKILNDIESDMVKDNSIPREPDNIPYLPTGQYNQAIPTDMLNSLPIHLQNRWHRIDFEKFNAIDEEPIEDEIEQLEPVDIFTLNPEKKDMIKDITFGEISVKESIILISDFLR